MLNNKCVKKIFKGKSFLFFSVILFFSFNCSKVVDTVSTLMISDQEEMEMGRQFHNEIKADKENYPFYKDKADKKQELIDYIDSIGAEIENAQQDRDIPFHFTIIDKDSVVNAFAVPGGYVYVYTGLILAAEDETELAAVIAHEVGHITERHGVEVLLKQYGYSFLMDIFVGDSSALRTIMNAAGGLAFLKLSRSNEYEADSCSVEYTTEAGYNPEGMKTFLEKLGEMGGNQFEPLSTHPDSDKRIDSVSTWINAKPQYIREREKPDIRVYP